MGLTHTLLGNNFLKVLFSFAILAAIFTALMQYLPTYSEGDYWGRMLNNFIYFVAIYLAARWAFQVEKVTIRK